MKKKLIVFVSILVLVIIGVYFYLGENSKINPKMDTFSCTGARGTNDSCWTELAVKNKDSSYCTNVSGRAMSGNAPDCYKQVYIAIGDAESCGKLYSSADGMECYYEISKTQGADICKSLSNVSLDMCNAGILIYGIINGATTTKNQSICNELVGNHANYKEQCLTSAFVAIGDVSLCSQLTDYKEGCIYQIQNK